MDKFFISRNTLAIISIDNKKCQVIEKDANFYVENSSYYVVNSSCLNFGSSLKGRGESTTFLTGIKYKTPIIINEQEMIVFFPTTSPSKRECIWLNYKEVSNYYNYDFNNYIVFKNGVSIKINVSNHIVSNQILKSSRLESIFLSKKA